MNATKALPLNRLQVYVDLPCALWGERVVYIHTYTYVTEREREMNGRRATSKKNASHPAALPPVRAGRCM